MVDRLHPGILPRNIDLNSQIVMLTVVVQHIGKSEKSVLYIVNRGEKNQVGISFQIA